MFISNLQQFIKLLVPPLTPMRGTTSLAYRWPADPRLLPMQIRKNAGSRLVCHWLDATCCSTRSPSNGKETDAQLNDQRTEP